MAGDMSAANLSMVFMFQAVQSELPKDRPDLGKHGQLLAQPRFGVAVASVPMLPLLVLWPKSIGPSRRRAIFSVWADTPTVARWITPLGIMVGAVGRNAGIVRLEFTWLWG